MLAQQIKSALFIKTPSMVEARSIPYATTHLQHVADEDDDRVFLSLDSAVAQPVGDDEILSVSYEDGIVRWVGVDGREYQMGDVGDPFDLDAGECLQQDDGLLVLFVENPSGAMKRWIVIKAG